MTQHANEPDRRAEIMRRSSQSPSSNTPSTTVKTGDIRISGAIIAAPR
jgi:hypothetical protein